MVKLNKTYMYVSADFNYMLLCVFVLVVVPQKLEVCIHKQKYISTWLES